MYQVSIWNRPLPFAKLTLKTIRCPSEFGHLLHGMWLSINTNYTSDLFWRMRNVFRVQFSVKQHCAQLLLFFLLKICLTLLRSVHKHTYTHTYAWISTCTHILKMIFPSLTQHIYTLSSELALPLPVNSKTKSLIPPAQWICERR